MLINDNLSSTSINVSKKHIYVIEMVLFNNSPEASGSTIASQNYVFCRKVCGRSKLQTRKRENICHAKSFGISYSSCCVKLVYIRQVYNFTTITIVHNKVNLKLIF